MNFKKWTPLIIIGLLIAAWDYYIYLGWNWIYEHSYTCIKTSDGLGEYCGIMWSTSPLLAYAFTGIAIIGTFYYGMIILDRTGLIKWDVI
jgi:hypothetical protein